MTEGRHRLSRNGDEDMRGALVMLVLLLVLLLLVFSIVTLFELRTLVEEMIEKIPVQQPKG